MNWDEKALEIAGNEDFQFEIVGKSCCASYIKLLRAEWERENADEIRLLKEQHAFAIDQLTGMAESRLASELAQEKPLGWICDDDLAFLQRDGECTIYQERQEFTIIPAPVQHPLFTRPAAAQPEATVTIKDGCAVATSAKRPLLDGVYPIGVSAAQPVPQGMVSVPVEPTNEMLEAGSETTCNMEGEDCVSEVIKAVWTAMLAASKETP